VYLLRKAYFCNLLRIHQKYRNWQKLEKIKLWHNFWFKFGQILTKFWSNFGQMFWWKILSMKQNLDYGENFFLPKISIFVSIFFPLFFSIVFFRLFFFDCFFFDCFFLIVFFDCFFRLFFSIVFFRLFFRFFSIFFLIFCRFFLFISIFWVFFLFFLYFLPFFSRFFDKIVLYMGSYMPAFLQLFFLWISGSLHHYRIGK